MNPLLDVYLQADTGENTTFDGGDENAEPAGLVGVGLNNMLGGKLTVLWLTHLGPEDATNAIGTLANSAMRYESDVVATYKPGGKWSFAGEGQWQHEDSTGAEFYGAALYASYTLTSTLTANGRVEAVARQWRLLRGGLSGQSRPGPRTRRPAPAPPTAPDRRPTAS